MDVSNLELTAVVAVTVAAIACVTDVRSRRIPNALTFGAAAAALVWHGVAGGPSGVLGAVAGWALGTLLFLPFFLLGGMGAGDVKLLAALGAWLGPGATVWLAIYSSIAGGVFGVAVALARGYMKTAIANIAMLVGYWRREGLKPAPDLTLASSRGPTLAYAIPILAGTVVTLWLR